MASSRRLVKSRWGMTSRGRVNPYSPGTQGDRLRGSGIPARALLCFMSRLATSEVGHGEQSDKAAPDRTLLGPQGPAPNLEDRLPAPGDHAACALRNAGGSGGLRRSPALGV